MSDKIIIVVVAILCVGMGACLLDQLFKIQDKGGCQCSVEKK